MPLWKTKVQMEIVICYNSRTNIVSRYRTLLWKCRQLVCLSSFLVDCLIYLFIIFEKNTLDALQS